MITYMMIYIALLLFQVKTTLCGGYEYKSMNIMKPGIYVKGCTNFYICIKFKNSNIKNGLRNAIKIQITN